MRAYYVDFYGCHADLCQYLNRETTRLTIRSRDGAIIHRKEYRTWRGAKIAMGKLGDCWRNELLSAKSDPRKILILAVRARRKIRTLQPAPDAGEREGIP